MDFSGLGILTTTKELYVAVINNCFVPKSAKGFRQDVIDHMAEEGFFSTQYKIVRIKL